MTIGDSTGARRHPELREALRKLTTGDGVLREDLVRALQGELRELQRCWRVNLNSGVSVGRQTIRLNLDAHIQKLPLPPRRPNLSPKDHQERYEHAIRVCFNIYAHPELKGKDLTQRQA